MVKPFKTCRPSAERSAFIAMQTDALIAIDTHTTSRCRAATPSTATAGVRPRCRQVLPLEPPPTMDETIAFYREKKIGFVNFTVDAETQMGRRRIPNEEIAEAAMANSDIMIAFGSIDPHKGKFGAREARKLVEEYGVKGFKFHLTVQGFEPADKMAGRSTRSSTSTSCRRCSTAAIQASARHALRRGLRLQNSNPMLLEDVAIASPTCRSSSPT